MNINTSFELETEAEKGTVIIIKKDGSDGGRYPMLEGANEGGPWVFGCSEEADLRLKVLLIIFLHITVMATILASFCSWPTRGYHG